MKKNKLILSLLIFFSLSFTFCSKKHEPKVDWRDNFIGIFTGDEVYYRYGAIYDENDSLVPGLITDTVKNCHFSVVEHPKSQNSIIVNLYSSDNDIYNQYEISDLYLLDSIILYSIFTIQGESIRLTPDSLTISIVSSHGIWWQITKAKKTYPIY
jgi:hypothetical protein